MKMRLLRLMAVGYGLLASGWLAFVIPVVGPLVWLGAVLALAAGALESSVVQRLYRARLPSYRERGALGPALLRLEQVGLHPPILYVATGLRRPAEWAGRDCIVIDLRLVEKLRHDSVCSLQVVAAIGHAVTCQRLSLARFDIAVRVGSLPVTFLEVLVRRSPLMSSLWRLRGATVVFLAITLALAPSAPAEDSAARLFALAAAVALALSYIPPRAERAWRTRLERMASEQVARAFRDAGSRGEMSVAWASASRRRTVATGHAMASSVGPSSAHIPTPGAGGR